MTDSIAASPMGPAEPVSGWLDDIDRLEAVAFTPLDDFSQLRDGARVKMDSQRSCAERLLPSVNPYGAPLPVRRSVHHATSDLPDVLRQDYSLDKLRLTLFETVEFLLIRVEQSEPDLMQATPPARSALVKRLASEILIEKGTYYTPTGVLQPYDLRLPVPASLTEGSYFSTNPTREPHTLRSAIDRVDGGVRGGKLYFLYFKARGGGSGRVIFLNPQHWFDGDCWKPYEAG